MCTFYSKDVTSVFGMQTLGNFLLYGYYKFNLVINSWKRVSNSILIINMKKMKITMEGIPSYTQYIFSSLHYSCKTRYIIYIYHPRHAVDHF